MSEGNENGGIDLAGFGKIAKAIPPKVYERSADVLLKTFQDLTAPLTQTTTGFGRYLRQKFDNMVSEEKAIATYTLEHAVERAKARAKQAGRSLTPPTHTKSFIRSLEEASKETDPLLHEMWANLLASQLTGDACHPHFVEVLPHFSPSEAKLLTSLLPKQEVGPNGGAFLSYEADCFTHWIRKSGAEENQWTLSCDLLCEFRFIDLLAPIGSPVHVTLLYRTSSGNAFLSAVSRPDGCKDDC